MVWLKFQTVPFGTLAINVSLPVVFVISSAVHVPLGLNEPLRWDLVLIWQPFSSFSSNIARGHLQKSR